MKGRTLTLLVLLLLLDVVRVRGLNGGDGMTTHRIVKIVRILFFCGCIWIQRQSVLAKGRRGGASVRVMLFDVHGVSEKVSFC